MPRYEYKCPDCGHEWEETRSMAEIDTARCLECLAQGRIVFSAAPPTMWFPGSTRTFTPSAKERKRAADRHE
jgi:putative FmdB family regulatory protein